LFILRLKNIFDFLLLGALWGMSYVFIRLTVGTVAPIVMVESRLLIGAICIGVFSLFIQSWRVNLVPFKKDLPRITLISIFNSVLPFAFFAYSMQYLNAGVGGILNSVSPIWSAIIGALWLKERLNISRICGLMLGCAGIVFLMWGKAHFSEDGLGLAVLASVCLTLSYGIASNMIKVYGQGIPTNCLTFSSLAIGALILLIPALQQLPEVALSTSVWVGILGLGIGSTAIGYILFFRLIEDTSPSIAISVTFLVPVFSILWGTVFLDEVPTMRMLIGGLIIVLGTALAVGFIQFPNNKKIRFE